MAYVHFDRNYAPCAFLIVRDGGDPYSAADTILIQTDWDYPGVASRMGWQACGCGETDGTVKCAHRHVGDMIAEAEIWIRDREGEPFPELNDYLAD